MTSDLETMDPAATPSPVSPPRSPLQRVVDLATTVLPTSAILLSILTFAGYAMGLVRDRMFARTFGAGPELDAYNAAFVLPELALDVLVAGGLVAPFVPLFTGLRAEAAETARAFGRSILTIAVGVMGVTSLVLIVFASQTVSLIAPGFDASQRQLYVDLFRLMCVTPVIFAASIVLGEVLVAERRFLAYGLAPLMYNGGIVAGTLLLGDRIGIFGAAVGAIAGAVLHLTIRIIGILRTSIRLRPTIHLRVRGLREFLLLMAPKMLSHPIEPLTFMYFTSLASRFEVGSVSSVSFARNFESVPVSLIGASFAIAAFPLMSAAAAAGDRSAFRRVFTTNLLTIGVITTVGAVVLALTAGFLISFLLGGGAFDDADTARTTTILAVFAIAIPFESLTHLLARAIYATRNTILPTIASVAGFATTVIVAEGLAPSVGLSAVPLGFAAGMAVKVVILSVALVPRIARIGRASEPRWSPQAARPVGALRLRSPIARRLGAIALSVALVVLAIGVVHGAAEALSGAALQYAPVVTPWTRVNPTAPPPSLAVATASVTAPAASGGSGRPSASAKPVPTPTPGPFAMDLYQAGDDVEEARDIWCVPAAMQTSMNIMDAGADTTKATQQRLFNLARSIAPAPDGAVEPEGWAAGLTQLGYGGYEVRTTTEIRGAVQLAAAQIRLTGRPAGLLVWRGAHSWVVSGFTATADPATNPGFKVTGLYIEDVWYPRISSIWGASNPPDTLVPVSDLSIDYLKWDRPRGSYPDKNGRYVLVVPVQ
ncbi:MAG TPA: lipid II flippase MurJ [Candidatus Limnocylindrales bacterium]